MTTLRLKKSQSFIYQGHMPYLVAYDHDAGQKNVYTVLALNVDDPITIGRELPLKNCREVITNFDRLARKVNPNCLGRRSVLRTLKEFRQILEHRPPNAHVGVTLVSCTHPGCGAVAWYNPGRKIPANFRCPWHKNFRCAWTPRRSKS